MKERGQIFTLDMFFALTLMVLVVSYSGLALEQARRQAEEYSLRYSLERTANDAADVLVKTLGKPENWGENAEMLETPGFAEENEENPVPNTISIMKFGQFRRLTNSDNWVAPVNASAVEAIKKLFGGSENFEIRILDEDENELWHAFPRWITGEVGENSGAENSLEVVTVRRLVAVKYGTALKGDSGRIVKEFPGVLTDNLEFNIYLGELGAFDWYIIVQGAGNARVSIWVNKAAAQPYSDPDYTFNATVKTQEIFPNPNVPYRVEHGGIENDPNVGVQLHEDPTLNFLGIKFEPQAPGWLRIYVVIVPSCSDPDTTTLALETLPATLEVKLWR